ncbi:sulfur carrier protein ThiS [Rhodovulum sp. DZ06]|uniref:sulfur carrier protein ThiS n=1 Tax=Rhodovulum sp. DZ06 TaxID=3425126 RepID=UPI003D3574A0
MRILLNGDPLETEAATVGALLEAEGLGGAKVATALNEEFIPAAQRAETALKDGDRLEVLAPMQGG